MTFIHIQKKTVHLPTGESLEQFAVPAMAIVSAQGRRLIPNPAGQEACLYPTLEEAQDAVRRAGFDYIFEGRKTYTLDRSHSPRDGEELTSLQGAVALLMDRLHDRETAVIANAAYALGELRAQEAAEPLTALLGHEDPTVRKQVAEAMAKLGEISLRFLSQAFAQARHSREKNASHIRLSVMTAYLEMGRIHRALAGIVLPQAVEALNDENWIVRAQAALVIGEMARQLRQENLLG